MADHESNDDNLGIAPTETSIASFWAMVFVEFGEVGNWVLACEDEWSQIHLSDDSIDNSHHIFAWTAKSEQVLINCDVTCQCKYIQGRNNFHVFVDDQGNRIGLSFLGTESAIKQATHFMKSVRDVINKKREMKPLRWTWRPLEDPTYNQLPIFMRATQQTEKAVFGFIHATIDFAPRSLCQLIHGYFLMLLNVKSTRAELEWRFDAPLYLALYAAYETDDTFASRQFEICGCVFRLEMALGCGRVWLRLIELPAQIEELSVVDFAVHCDELAYKSHTQCSAKISEKHPVCSFAAKKSFLFSRGWRAKHRRLRVDSLTFHCCVEIMGVVPKEDQVVLKVYRRPKDAMDE